MKIGIPTNDGKSISEHFGRSAAFLIYEVENGEIKSRKLSSNHAQHGHGAGNCHHGSGANTGHNHAGILAALEGCEMVICAGMGQGAAQALARSGKQIIVTAPGLAEEMVSAYCAGKLPGEVSHFCQCSHHEK